jgi:hypothetical protein
MTTEAGWYPDPDDPIERDSGAGTASAAAPTTAAQPATATHAPETRPDAPDLRERAGWHPDPTGRYEHRYLDGIRWTEHVARGGERFTDRLG